MLLNRAFPDIFTAPEAQFIARLMDEPVLVLGRTRLIRAQTPLAKSMYLNRGMVGRYTTDRQ